MIELDDSPPKYLLNFYRGENSAYTWYVSADLSGIQPRAVIRQLDSPLLTLTVVQGLAVQIVPAADVPERQPDEWAGNWTRVDVSPTKAQRDTMFGKAKLWGDLAFPMPDGRDFTIAHFENIVVNNDSSGRT